MAGPIRIAHVMGKMVGGGVEAFVMNYYRHVDRSRIQFDFIVDSDSTLVPTDEIETLGGNIYVVPSYQDIINYQRCLIDLFQCNSWNIVHSHLNTLSVFPLRAAQKAGVPVRIAHSHSTLGREELKRNIAKLVLRPFSTRYATDLFACSKHAGDWLFGSGSKYTVINNAIDLDRFTFDSHVRERLRAELGISESDFVVGAVGRLVTQKNYQFLLSAFSVLLKRKRDSWLVIVGDGPLRDQLKSACIDLAIQDRVLFLGLRNDANEFYQAFDVFAMPSVYEGLGIAVIEAQASGLPCVLSNAVPGEAQVTDRCSFIDLNSAESWAERLAACDAVRDRETDLSLFQSFDIKKAARYLANLYFNLYENA